MRNCLRPVLSSSERERRGGDSTAGERSHAGQQAFCTLTNPSDGLNARLGPDRSRDELFAQVRRPGICEPCSTRPPSPPPPAPAVHRRAPLRREQTEGGGMEDQLLPPFTGGLHCGSSNPGVNHSPQFAAPAVHRRAPLRRWTPPEGRPYYTAAPAVHRRAPLRSAPVGAEPDHFGTCSRRPPAGSIAAPASVPRAYPATCACSRRSPAGSIAARGARPVRPTGSVCSRRSSAGSIAARVTRSTSGDFRSAPAVHRRAPLRQPDGGA